MVQSSMKTWTSKIQHKLKLVQVGVTYMSSSRLVSLKSPWNRSMVYVLRETTLFGHSYGIWLTCKCLRGCFLWRANFFFAFPFDGHFFHFHFSFDGQYFILYYFWTHEVLGHLASFVCQVWTRLISKFICISFLLVMGAKMSLDHIPSTIVGATSRVIIRRPFQHVWVWIRHWTSLVTQK